MLDSTLERRDCPSEDDFNYLNLYFSEAAEMCMELEDWSDEVNTKHDASSYESCGYEREIISDANVLLDAYNKASQNSSWKPQVQQFEKTYWRKLGNSKRRSETESMSCLQRMTLYSTNAVRYALSLVTKSVTE